MKWLLTFLVAKTIKQPKRNVKPLQRAIKWPTRDADQPRRDAKWLQRDTKQLHRENKKTTKWSKSTTKYHKTIAEMQNDHKIMNNDWIDIVTINNVELISAKNQGFLLIPQMCPPSLNLHPSMSPHKFINLHLKGSFNRLYFSVAWRKGCISQRQNVIGPVVPPSCFFLPAFILSDLKEHRVFMQLSDTHTRTHSAL